MGSYDSPNFTDRVPGRVVVESTGLGGSQPTRLPETSEPLSDRIQQGTVGSSAVVGHQFESLASAVVVPVGPLDTLVPREADLYVGRDPNPVLGTVGDEVGFTGIGKGHVVTPVHPNSNGTG